MLKNPYSCCVFNTCKFVKYFYIYYICDNVSNENQINLNSLLTSFMSYVLHIERNKFIFHISCYTFPSYLPV